MNTIKIKQSVAVAASKTNHKSVSTQPGTRKVNRAGSKKIYKMPHRMNSFYLKMLQVIPWKI